MIRVLDPFYRKIVGDTSGIFLVICGSLMFCTTITGIIGNIAACVWSSNIVYVTHIAFSVVYIVAGIIFIASYGTVSVRKNSFDTVYDYITKHRYETDNYYINRFSHNVYKIKNSTLESDITDAVHTYVDQRTEDSGSATLGGLCAWTLFSCFMVYLWFTRQRSPLQPNDIAQFNSATGEDASQLNQRILSSSLTQANIHHNWLQAVF